MPHPKHPHPPPWSCDSWRGDWPGPAPARGSMLSVEGCFEQTHERRSRAHPPPVSSLHRVTCRGERTGNSWSGPLRHTYLATDLAMRYAMRRAACRMALAAGCGRLADGLPWPEVRPELEPELELELELELWALACPQSELSPRLPRRPYRMFARRPGVETSICQDDWGDRTQGI